MMNSSTLIRLSPYHKIFYNEWKLEPLSNKYNIVFDQTIGNTLDISRLQQALERFIADYLILNSHIKSIDGEPHWVANFAIRHLEVFADVTSYDQLYAHVSQPFNIESDPLYRFAIFKQTDGNYRFILVWHHLLLDGGSFNELIAEIANYYKDVAYKTNLNLEEQKSLIFTRTQELYNKLETVAHQGKQFWQNLIADTEAIDLRFLRMANPHVQQTQYKQKYSPIKEIRFDFTDNIISELDQFNQKYGSSTYSYGLIIFTMLIHRYTLQAQFAISYPITIKENMRLLYGAGINTILCPFKFETATTILDLIAQYKEFLIARKNSQGDYKYYLISDILTSENKNILDVFFIQTNLKDIPFKLDNVNTININKDFNIDLPAKLLFEQEKYQDKICYRVRYNENDIDAVILQQFINHYKKLFVEILADFKQNNVNKLVSQYQILTDAEYKTIVYDWNNTYQPYHGNKTIHQLFEEQVLRTPDNIAIVYEDNRLTYAELNEKSNQLAHYIRNTYNIKGDDLIALYLDRSEYMVIAIIGVIKAGGAYVPIDMTCPAPRIRYILNDIKTKVLITNQNNSDYIRDISITDDKHSNNHKQNSLLFEDNPSNITPHCDQSYSNAISIIAIDSHEVQSQLKQQVLDNPVLNVNGNNLAYVMYTSGTTGVPKGVMLEQYSVTIRIMSMIEKSNINTESKYLFKTNYVFDVSFSDIFMVLLSGASLHITKSIFDIEEICNLIAKNNINICHFVPSQLDVIHDYLNAKDLFNNLQVINVSGEKFDKSLINKNSSIKYINYYGPTEAGEVSCDITDCKNKLLNHLKLGTIGYPLSQSTLYVLDSNLQPLAIGAIGELYIGGAGLARAYLNLPELTQKMFISNPFQTKEDKLHGKNARLYKTGDLVRYLLDGNIEYIGRGDSQVKIRGFRVELDEVAATLSNYPEIKQAVVLAQAQIAKMDRNEQYLVAYYVSNAKLDENLISEYLSKELPEYMIPSLFIYLEHLPLTANGKLDKSALPKANFHINIDNYVGPRNELEQKICIIYADILKLNADQIGINDSFFKLGGNSILAIRLMFKLQGYFNITVNDIFEYKTPAKLVQNLPSSNINLVDRLEQIKLIYSKLDLDKENIHIAIEHSRDLYQQQQVKSSIFNSTTKTFSTVLLTGATGYLGCHLLYQLLSTTNHAIYLPIRANSKELPYTRLHNKFRYYFNIDLNVYLDRINVFSSDLSKTNLGLSQLQYEELTSNIDSVIHSAALVKHHGNNNEFYLENVQATINLLELAKLTINKDFHYISTIGVFTNTRVLDNDYNIFIEDSIDDNRANLDNLYTKTKYQGEQATIKYREYGIKSNIYRVGNLAVNSATYKTQENIEDNAFFQRVKTIYKLGVIPQELSEVEISPVNCTATAITLLFNQAGLHNQIYHVFDSQKYSLHNLFCEDKINAIKKVSLSEFIDVIIEQLTDNINTHQVELFMLHQWGLQPNINNLAKTIVFQDKTSYLLNQLKFKWVRITNKMLSDITKKC